jgi:hypothetical protein
MLRAIHERESRWDEVDPDTEIARLEQLAMSLVCEPS